MKRNYPLAWIALLAAFSATQAMSLVWAQEHKAPPVTRVDKVAETLHGVTITDPYRWLEDQNSPETRAWINAQSEYTASTLGSLPIRSRIREWLTQLLKIDTISAPFARGERYFLSKRKADQNQSVIYVRTDSTEKTKSYSIPIR